jgi:hypothetical protein
MGITRILRKRRQDGLTVMRLQGLSARFMASRSRVAGVVGLLSLVVPWVVLLQGVGGTVYWLPFQFDFGQVAIYVNFVKFFVVDDIVRTLTFVFVIVGAILLVAKSSSRRLGASIVLAGVIVSSANFIFMQQIYMFLRPPSGGFIAIIAAPTVVPLGLALAFLAAVIEFAAPHPKRTSSATQLIVLNSSIKSSMLKNNF